MPATSLPCQQSHRPVSLRAAPPIRRSGTSVTSVPRRVDSHIISHSAAGCPNAVTGRRPMLALQAQLGSVSNNGFADPGVLPGEGPLSGSRLGLVDAECFVLPCAAGAAFRASFPCPGRHRRRSLSPRGRTRPPSQCLRRSRHGCSSYPGGIEQQRHRRRRRSWRRCARRHPRFRPAFGARPCCSGKLVSRVHPRLRRRAASFPARATPPRLRRCRRVVSISLRKLLARKPACDVYAHTDGFPFGPEGLSRARPT
jgi:hypothetical protein